MGENKAWKETVGLVTRQHKICNLKPDKHVNFLASFPDVLTLWPMLSFSFNLFICPSSVTNVELKILEERRKKQRKMQKGGLVLSSWDVSSQEEAKRLGLLSEKMWRSLPKEGARPGKATKGNWESEPGERGGRGKTEQKVRSWKWLNER